MRWLTNASWFAFGMRAFTRGGYERAAAAFADGALQSDHAGKLVAVTGANSGVGFEAAKALAARGCSVLMLCRSRERGEAAAERVRRETGSSDVHLHVCDVSSLHSIESFASAFLADSKRPLHALVNNAGALLAERGRSGEGLDLSFATNTLGGVALAARLLPALRAAPGARVVFVSSGGMYTGGGSKRDFGAGPFRGGHGAHRHGRGHSAGGAASSLQSTSAAGSIPTPSDNPTTQRTPHSKTEKLELSGWDDASAPWDGTRAYALDKRRQVAAAEELARRWGPLGVKVVSMHPGWADTEGVRTSLPGFAEKMGSRLRTAAQGADTITWLCLEDAAKLEGGAFYLDRAPQAKHLTWSGTEYDDSAAAALVDKLLGLAGLGAPTAA